VPYFDTLTGNLDFQVVKPAVKPVLRRIEAQSVSHFGVGDCGAYRAIKIIVEVKSTASGLVGEPDHDVRRRVRIETSSSPWRIWSFQATYVDGIDRDIG